MFAEETPPLFTGHRRKIAENTKRWGGGERGGGQNLTRRLPTRSLRNGVRKNGVRNRCPYRNNVDTEIPSRLPFWGEFCLFCQSVWLPGSILNFRIGSVSSIGGVDCRDPVCRHRFRFLDPRKTVSDPPHLGTFCPPIPCNFS